jgi:hypothetical protein
MTVPDCQGAGLVLASDTRMKMPPCTAKLSFALALLLATAVWTRAQISVGPAGSGTITFNNLPTVAQGWSTLAVGNASGGAYLSVPLLESNVQTVVASSVNTALGSSTTIAAATAARWNSVLQKVQTRPTGSDYLLLMATLRNNVGNLVDSVTVSYAYAVETGAVPDEEIPGHRAFYSLTGAPGSWQPIPSLSGINSSATLTATFNVTWPTNSLLYLLWADDNAVNNDGAYTIDNFSVTATVFTNIFITNQPQNVVVPQGSPAMFTVGANGAPPLRYQWLKDSMEIVGATNSVLAIDATTPGDLGGYSVTVSNSFTSVLSSNATLTFGTNPVAILTQPADSVVNAGQPASFSVQISGSVPRLQWFRNGSLLADATNQTLLIPAGGAPDAGVYFVTVSNVLNTVSSSNATLHVRLPGSMLLPFTNVWRYEASGSNLGTTWREPGFDDALWSNGLAVLGLEDNAIVAPLIRTPLPLTNAGGSIITYYFRTRFQITNDLASFTMLASNLLDDGAVYYLNGVEFHRQAMPEGTIGSGTSATANSAGFSEGTFFTTPVPVSLAVPGTNVLAVEVHQFGSGSSDVAFGLALHLVPSEIGPAVIRAHPTNRVALTGGTVIFAAQAAGTLPLALQWFHNDEPVHSATNQTLTLTNVSDAQAGLYRLEASNEINVAVSSSAELKILSSSNLMATLLHITNAWRYQTGRVDLGTSWRQTNFSDAAWPSGRGLFASHLTGYPEPVNTVVTRGNLPFEGINTYYFRTHFLKLGTNSEGVLVFSNLLDDGAVFYLNGAEIFRTRITDGPVNYNTPASSSAPADGQQYERVLVPVATLRPTNLLAVEVHQSSPSSSDAAFGTRVGLIPGAGEPVVILEQPQDLTVPSGYPASLDANVFGSAPVHLQWFKDGVPVPAATNQTLSIAVTTTNDAGSYVLFASNLFNAVTSSAAILTILPETNPPVVLVRGPYLQNATTQSVVLRWRTSVPAQSRSFFGTAANDLTFSAFDPVLRTNHLLTLTNLAPDTRYYYSVWTGFSNLAVGNGFTFLTPPVAAKPTRIWVQGDSGTATPAARAVVDAFLGFNGGPPDVWLMLGDNAYTYGTDAEYQTAVFNFMPDVLRQTLLWTTIGNHETYSVGAPGPFPYLDIFSPPTAGEAGGVPSGTKYYYSFDYGNIHFVSLDSEESDRSPSGSMAQWLQADLAANTKDWLIAFWHSPPYTRGSHNSDNIADSGGRMTQMRENILPILESYGVDLVLGGHSHCYERSFLLDGHYGYSHTLQPLMLKDAGSGQTGDTGAYRKTGAGPTPREGTVYVVAGSSGHATFGTLDHPVMRVSLLEMGSLVIDVNNQRLDALFLRETGEVKDQFTILKGVQPEALRVATFHRVGGQVHGAWKSVAGRTYQVEASLAVTGMPWVSVADPVLATGATSRWTNDVVEASAFYRVRDVTVD